MVVVGGSLLTYPQDFLHSRMNHPECSRLLEILVQFSVRYTAKQAKKTRTCKKQQRTEKTFINFHFHVHKKNTEYKMCLKMYVLVSDGGIREEGVDSIKDS